MIINTNPYLTYQMQQLWYKKGHYVHDRCKAIVQPSPTGTKGQMMDTKGCIVGGICKLCAAVIGCAGKKNEPIKKCKSGFLSSWQGIRHNKGHKLLVAASFSTTTYKIRQKEHQWPVQSP